MPLWVGQGQNLGLRDVCHILTLLPVEAFVFLKHMSSYLMDKIAYIMKCLTFI